MNTFYNRIISKILRWASALSLLLFCTLLTAAPGQAEDDTKKGPADKGQPSILIIDVDDNHSSGPIIQSTIQTIGMACDYVTSFPSNFNGYTTIFVCLGIYSSNYELTNSEGQALAGFLNEGGGLYMEGGDTWAFDDQTPVHPMFNIVGLSDGTGDMGVVVGQTGTFTEGMSFNYTGENNWMDHLAATPPAELIFQNQSPLYGTAVAYDQGTYRTIGAAHEFSGLSDGSSPSTKVELMEQYLYFLKVYVTANFTSNATDICETDVVNFEDISQGNITSWNWSFPGGVPSSSTEPNPVVAYNNTGDYDVRLIVTDGFSIDTLFVDNYIHVSETPGIPPYPIGPSLLCQDPLNTLYSTAGTPLATSYQWQLLPENAGVISGITTNATVNWDALFTGIATIKVAGVNYCGTGAYSGALNVLVNPLPTVTINFPDDSVCSVAAPFALTGGYPAGGTYSGPGVSNGIFDPSVAGMGTHTITYTYTDQYACTNSTEATITVYLCTGTTELTDGSLLQIYPNPSHGDFSVNFTGQVNDQLNIQVFNTLNQIVYSSGYFEMQKGQKSVFHIREMKEGLYQLQINGKFTKISAKLIVTE